MDAAKKQESDCKPETIHKKINCAGKGHCPKCGKRGKRVKTHRREVRSIAYQKILILKITYGEYRAKCSCCKTFCNSPEGILPRAQYDNKVREAVLNRILEDGMNVEGVRRAMERDFLLNLSSGFVYDCLNWAVKQLDMGEHREKILALFSGTLCVDELHLGQYILLLATDPLQDIPVAFALVKANDQDHMERFLRNLANWGLQPKVVVTDGSNLYPKLLAAIWPGAEHQLCVFHVLQDINKHILDEVRRLRKKMARLGNRGRRARRGRKSKAQKARQQRAGLTNKEKAKFIYKHRYLMVTKEENMTAADRQNLMQMLDYLPELRTLREFAQSVNQLFAKDQTEEQAKNRRQALLANQAFQAYPGLVKALDMLTETNFAKMIAFLRSPVGWRVRTNNHAERTNRKLRWWEKIRYKWRRRRTLVRFLCLALDRWWHKAWEKQKTTGVELTSRRYARSSSSWLQLRRQPPTLATEPSGTKGLAV